MLCFEKVRIHKIHHYQTLLLLKNLSQAPNEKATCPNEKKRSNKCPFNTCLNPWSTIISLEDFHGQHLTEVLKVLSKSMVILWNP
ncbi:hypothetical protein MKX03_025950, partial [Papaver bracteatum]